MPKKLLIVLIAVIALAAACGSESIEATGGGEAPGDSNLRSETDDAMDDDAAMDADDDSANDARTDSMMDGPADGGGLLFAQTLAEATTNNSAQFEGRFSMTGVDPDVGDVTVEMTMSGAYDLAAESMELTIDLSDLFASGLAGDTADIPPGFESFFAEPMKLITIGDEGWLNWSLLSMFTGQDDVWMALEPDEFGSATASFGFTGGGMNPTELLDSLAGANANIEDLGVESLRGVQTRRWRVLLDLDSLAADLDATERAELENSFGGLDDAAYPMEIWVGVDDGFLYRYDINVTGEALLSASEPGEGLASISFEFFDHGKPQGIVPPPAGDIIDGSSLFGQELG